MEQEVRTIKYPSPVGVLTLTCDESAIVGLWMENQKYYLGALKTPPLPGDTPLLRQAQKWLDAYFAGKAPSPDALPLRPQGSDFQQAVWKLLLQIPYGKTVTYGQLAARIAQNRGVPAMSAQAIGGAVGKNPISIIIPCHRVLGSQGQLTGYAAGVEKKLWLLHHEGVALSITHRLPFRQDSMC